MKKASIRSFVIRLLVAVMVAQAIPARSEMIRPVFETPSHRERIAAVLARDDVRAQLVARGVDPARVDARVAALTDQEAAVLASELDNLPAGGGGGDPISAIVMAALFIVAVVVVVPVLLVVAIVRAAGRHQAANSQ